jgi:hypothetical protein
LLQQGKKAVEENITTLIKTLQTYIGELRREIVTLTGENVLVNDYVPTSTDYYTNEELAKETEWNVLQ